MVYDYVITFKRRNDKTVDAVSQLMYFFAIVTFGYYAYTLPGARVYFLAIDLLMLLTWIYCIIKRQKKGFALFRLGLFIAVLGWLIAPGGRLLLAILYAVAGLIEKQVKFPEEIGFSENDVVVNSFPKKKFSWTDIANVVIKDNLLTVDFKNNKLIQKELDEEVSPATEAEFNAFCKIQLQKVAVNYQTER
jgi:hypothetical protein